MDVLPHINVDGIAGAHVVVVASQHILPLRLLEVVEPPSQSHQPPIVKLHVAIMQQLVKAVDKVDAVGGQRCLDFIEASLLLFGGVTVRARH